MLAVALNGLAFVLRRRSVRDVVTLALTLDPLIWVGLLGLAVSGVLLDPDVTRPLTAVKLPLVLLVALDGLWARDLMERLRRLPADVDVKIVQPLMRKALSSAAFSQFGWWGAIVIGFMATNTSY